MPRLPILPRESNGCVLPGAVCRMRAGRTLTSAPTRARFSSSSTLHPSGMNHLHSLALLCNTHFWRIVTRIGCCYCDCLVRCKIVSVRLLMCLESFVPTPYILYNNVCLCLLISLSDVDICVWLTI